MSNIRFTWDLIKARANFIKHRVTFDEALTAFRDENGLLISDPDHSSAEDRFILLGRTSRGGLLVVCHCYRETDTVIRIISARKASRREHNRYWESA